MTVTIAVACVSFQFGERMKAGLSTARSGPVVSAWLGSTPSGSSRPWMKVLIWYTFAAPVTAMPWGASASAMRVYHGSKEVGAFAPEL